VGLRSDIIGLPVGGALALLAAVRRGKAVHPHGVVHAGRLVVRHDAPVPRAARLFSEPGEHAALVRFSRSVGVPRPIPDLLGMSIRLPDVYGEHCHQDFMLVSSADIPVVHHLFLPATDVWERPYSSSLPYRAGGERFLIGALPDPDSPRPDDGDTELERLDAAARTGRLRFQLAIAPVMGRFQPVADLWIGERLPAELDALRFNPWNTGGGLEPAGALNGARDRAYKLSQAAWRRTRPDGARLQDAADRRLGLAELRQPAIGPAAAEAPARAETP
jgi:hypothetical protein